MFLESGQNDKEKVKVRKIPIYPGFPELERSDVSIHPTYSKLTLAYRVVCRLRYQKACATQKKQFMKELHYMEQLKLYALDGVRVHREFSQGVLGGKLPRPRNWNQYFRDTLTENQRRRIEDIVSGRIEFSLK